MTTQGPPKKRLFGLRATAGDSWIAFTVFAWILATVCGSTLASRNFDVLITGFLPVISAAGGCICASLWSRVLHKVTLRDQLRLLISFAGAAVFYCYSSPWTSYRIPDWAADWVNNGKLYPEYDGIFQVEATEQDFVAALLVMIIILVLGLILLACQRWIQQVLDFSWKHRIRVGVTAVLLMLPAASVFNSSMSHANVPYPLEVLGWVLGTAVGLPIGFLVFSWLSKVFFIWPTEWLGRASHFAIKLSCILSLVLAGTVLFPLADWQGWISFEARISGFWGLVASTFLASAALTTLSLAKPPEDVEDKTRPPQEPRNWISIAAIVPVILFAAFTYASIYLLDLRSLVTGEYESSSQAFETAYSLKRLRIESSGTIFPVNEHVTLVRFQPDSPENCLDSFYHASKGATHTLVLFDIAPHIRLEVASNFYQVCLESGEVSSTQLEELTAVNLVYLRGVELPSEPPEDLDLPVLFLGEVAPTNGLAETLDLYAKPSEDGYVHLDAASFSRKDWEAVLRASQHRTISIRAAAVPEFVLNDDKKVDLGRLRVGETRERMKEPKWVRFAVRNRVDLSRYYGEQSFTIWDAALKGRELPGLDSEFPDENSRWTYQRNVAGEPKAIWSVGGAAFVFSPEPGKSTTRILPSLEILHLDPIPNYSSGMFYGILETQEQSWSEIVPNLRELYFAPKKALQEHEQEQLGKLIKLHRLQIGYAPENFDDFKWLANLRELEEIRMFSIPDARMCQVLVKLPKLRRVEIYDAALEEWEVEVGECKQTLSDVAEVIFDKSYQPEIPKSMKLHLDNMEKRWLESLNEMIQD